jgi:hypothetical protein
MGVVAMKYRRILTKRGDSLPDVLLIAQPDGVYVWHPVDGATLQGCTLETLTVSDVVRGEQGTGFSLSPIYEHPRDLSHLDHRALESLAAGRSR